MDGTEGDVKNFWLRRRLDYVWPVFDMGRSGRGFCECSVADTEKTVLARLSSGIVVKVRRRAPDVRVRGRGRVLVTHPNLISGAKSRHTLRNLARQAPNGHVGLAEGGFVI